MLFLLTLCRQSPVQTTCDIDDPDTLRQIGLEKQDMTKTDVYIGKGKFSFVMSKKKCTFGYLFMWQEYTNIVSY